jgi:transcriptional regulator with XRE-family HTH domain
MTKPRSRPRSVLSIIDPDRDLGRIIGRHVRERRLSLSMTQEELGQFMALRLRASWNRQTVGRLERSERLLTIVELLVLAHALHTSVLDLILPAETEALVLDDGTVLTRHHVVALVFSRARKYPSGTRLRHTPRTP